MLKWLRKIFMEENKEKTEAAEVKTEASTEVAVQVEEPVVEQQVQAAPQNVQTQKPPTKKRFEVEIYDKISVGEGDMEHTQLQRVNYDKPVIIEASSKKDLQEFGEKLALCKQTFKIVRVLDDVPVAPQMQQQQPIQQNVQQQIQVQQPLVKRKPKYYKIGSIEIKDDNGKIYQKQWLKLTDEEMSNFRIVNNKTNAIVTLKDKSIEMKKWVLVETTEDTSATLEENMK